MIDPEARELLEEIRNILLDIYDKLSEELDDEED